MIKARTRFSRKTNVAKAILRTEKSENYSGVIQNIHLIPRLKSSDYRVINKQLDGDAPKQFIQVYIKQDNCRKRKPHNWTSFIAKSAEKWYPHESVIEYMINRVGQELGVVMNEIQLVRCNGQIRFLSKYFLNKNEMLIHGAEICGQHINDEIMAKEIANDKKTARDLFTFEFINEALKEVFPSSSQTVVDELVNMIIYDAIVGNNDRHFYNWGVIDSAINHNQVAFSPIYDTARGFMWNRPDADLDKILNNRISGGKKLDNYIENASPRISLEGNRQANHFELVKFVKSYDNRYIEAVKKLTNKAQEEKVLKMLNKEFFHFFSPVRCKVIEMILKQRFERLRNL